jgi:hypothetical protein
MHRKLTFAAVIFGFLGCCFGAMAAWKIEHMFTESSFSLGWGKDYSGFWWDHALLISFLLGGSAFILEFFAVRLDKRGHCRESAEREQSQQKLPIPSHPDGPP